MKMAMLLFFLLAAGSLAGSQGVELEPRRHCRVNCLSWRVANEANNTVGWSKVPSQCHEYLRHYLLGHQYEDDSQVVIDEAINYAQNLALPKDGRNIWVFDIDETVISSVQSFLDELESETWNAILPEDWVYTVEEEKATALPQSKRLYEEVLSLGIKVVFLTGRKESKRNSTRVALISAGFDKWELLILKGEEYQHLKGNKEFKSTIRAKLEGEGYRIVGNIGDQWSDITGPSPGRRAFKLPNPMYYLF